MGFKASFEQRVFWLTLLGGLPAVGLAFVWGHWAIGTALVVIWIACALLVRERVIHPLQTISNVLAALREGDYTMRARGFDPEDALGLVLLELNTLSDDMRANRLGALEATALLRRIMDEIDVAIFAFDDAGTLRLVNPTGAALLGKPPEQLLGRRAGDLGLEQSLTGDTPRVETVGFQAGGRWEIRRATFRLEGRPHQLLVLADLSRALRNEERQAWQRLIRVLSHELNNSLAPIMSIAESLGRAVAQGPPSGQNVNDLKSGLGVIASRSESLNRLMAGYARLARLPPPRREPVAVQDWVRRVVALETRCPVGVHAGPEVTIHADGAQLDQLLINLVRNAVDATLDGGAVEVGWQARNGQLEVWVRDEGSGLADTANLFVPFYTTKPTGSGIGLALSRQIAEVHGGALTLRNRAPEKGCEARLSLPIA